MAWSKPQFTRGEVDAAGRILAPAKIVASSTLNSDGSVSTENGFDLLADDTWDVTGFSSAEQAKASEVYLSTEKMIKDKPTAQAVLVSVESVHTLRTAFPNYFADTRVFIGSVKRALAL